MKFTYGVIYRPIGFATVPKGYIEVGTHPKYKHGTVTYDHKLTDNDQETFELDPILSEDDINKIVELIVCDLNEYKQEYIEMAEEDPRCLKQIIRQRFEKYPGSNSVFDYASIEQNVLTKLTEGENHGSK